MNALLEFFQGFGNAISAVIDFVIGFFQDLIYMIQLLGKVAAALPWYFGWLPSQVLSLLLLIVSIVVIYKILGREG